jgi:hypothetical protein
MQKIVTTMAMLLIAFHAKPQSPVLNNVVLANDKKARTIIFPERERIKTKAQLAKEEALLLAEKQEQLHLVEFNENQIFSINQVEIPPDFIGGQTKLEAFLGHNVNINIPVHLNAPNGLYKVIIKFVVNQDGSISGIKPLTSFGYDMEKEAMRVVAKTNNKWKPATIHNKIVACEKQVSINFNIDN